MMVSALADKLFTTFVKNADNMVVKDLKYLAKLAALTVVKEHRRS